MSKEKTKVLLDLGGRVVLVGEDRFVVKYDGRQYRVEGLKFKYDDEGRLEDFVLMYGYRLKKSGKVTQHLRHDLLYQIAWLPESVRRVIPHRITARLVR